MLIKNNKNLQKTVCPLYLFENIKGIYQQKNIPIFNNTTYNNLEKSKNCDKSKIILKLCNSCGFIFNSHLNR